MGRAMIIPKPYQLSPRPPAARRRGADEGDGERKCGDSRRCGSTASPGSMVKPRPGRAVLTRTRGRHNE
jgi:hypothetical protein